MFVIGLLNTLSTIFTLLDSTIIRTFIVYLLILTSISNQITLFSLMIQIIYILMNDSYMITNISLNYFLCKSISYIINVFTFIVKWSTAFININRLQQISMKTNQFSNIKRQVFEIFLSKHFFFFSI